MVIFPAALVRSVPPRARQTAGATIAADAADDLIIREAGHAQVEVKGLQIGKLEAELVGVPGSVSASLLSART
jgi:hypothetical protein